MTARIAREIPALRNPRPPVSFHLQLALNTATVVVETAQLAGGETGLAMLAIAQPNCQDINLIPGHKDWQQIPIAVLVDAKIIRRKLRRGLILPSTCRPPPPPCHRLSPRRPPPPPPPCRSRGKIISSLLSGWSGTSIPACRNASRILILYHIVPNASPAKHNAGWRQSRPVAGYSPASPAHPAHYTE